MDGRRMSVVPTPTRPSHARPLSLPYVLANPCTDHAAPNLAAVDALARARDLLLRSRLFPGIYSSLSLSLPTASAPVSPLLFFPVSPARAPTPAADLLSPSFDLPLPLSRQPSALQPPAGTADLISLPPSISSLPLALSAPELSFSPILLASVSTTGGVEATAAVGELHLNGNLRDVDLRREIHRGARSWVLG